MSSTSSPFGQNEWLVEEMYRKFRDDPSSVDPSWHEFLVDYNPESTGETPAEVKPAPAPPATAPPAVTPPQAAPVPAASGNGAPSAPKPATQAPAPKPASPPPAEGDEVQVLRGAAAAVVKNMSQSLDLP